MLSSSYNCTLRSLSQIRDSLLRACAPATQSAYHTSFSLAAEDGSQRKSPVDGQLYGRPDRDPAPSPASSMTQGTSAEAGDKANEPKDAYPVNASEDPAVTTENASPTGGKPLSQPEGAGPKAAGQGKLATTKDDYGGPDSASEQPQKGQNA